MKRGDSAMAQAGKPPLSAGHACTHAALDQETRICGCNWSALIPAARNSRLPPSSMPL